MKQGLTSEPLYGRAPSATDRAREALLPPTAPAPAPSTDDTEAVCRRCGATDTDRALPAPAPRPPPLSGSRPVPRLGTSPPSALVVAPGGGDGEAEGEAAESKSGLVRVLA